MRNFWPTQQKTQIHPEVKLFFQDKTLPTDSRMALRNQELHVGAPKDTSQQPYTHSRITGSDSVCCHFKALFIFTNGLHRHT